MSCSRKSFNVRIFCQQVVIVLLSDCAVEPGAVRFVFSRRNSLLVISDKKHSNRMKFHEGFSSTLQLTLLDILDMDERKQCLCCPDGKFKTNRLAPWCQTTQSSTTSNAGCISRNPPNCLAAQTHRSLTTRNFSCNWLFCYFRFETVLLILDVFFSLFSRVPACHVIRISAVPGIGRLGRCGSRLAAIGRRQRIPANDPKAGFLGSPDLCLRSF